MSWAHRSEVIENENDKFKNMKDNKTIKCQLLDNKTCKINIVCENCKIIRRRGVLRVICTDPRHKQRQGK